MELNEFTKNQKEKLSFIFQSCNLTHLLSKKINWNIELSNEE